MALLLAGASGCRRVARHRRRRGRWRLEHGGSIETGGTDGTGGTSVTGGTKGPTGGISGPGVPKQPGVPWRQVGRRAAPKQPAARPARAVQPAPEPVDDDAEAAPIWLQLCLGHWHPAWFAKQLYLPAIHVYLGGFQYYRGRDISIVQHRLLARKLCEYKYRTCLLRVYHRLLRSCERTSNQNTNPNGANLATGGAALITANYSKIISAYAWYAQQTYAVWKTKPLVWLLEGDIVNTPPPVNWLH